MTENDAYFLTLLSQGKIEIDYQTGNVYSWLSGKRRHVNAQNSAGYLHMSAGPSRSARYFILLHRLIWMSKHGDIPDRFEINHKNGNKKDNRLSNLECITRSENTLHAHHVLHKLFGLFGRDNRGENNGRSKLTWGDVLAIRRLFATDKYSQRELGEIFGVGRTQISNIVNNLQWVE